MSKRRVVLTGVGVVSPVGNNINDFWDSVINGKTGAARLTAFDPTHFYSQIAAEVKDFDAPEESWEETIAALSPSAIDPLPPSCSFIGQLRIRTKRIQDDKSQE